jgi:hypothetical protein
MTKQPGVAFEKVVAALQARFDPASMVSHNETIADRLEQKRQFDVVMRGQFAGQQVLGVIECKDTERRVGTPEVDAFQTKSADVNANLRIIISRSGFSAPAVEKCRHYGIQTLSLIHKDPVNNGFRFGTCWYAIHRSWGRIQVELHFQKPEPQVKLDLREVSIGKKKLVDWFTNYLVDHDQEYKEQVGWIVELPVKFSKAQVVEVGGDLTRLCVGITFKAERLEQQLEHFVGLQGDGFFDWQSGEGKFAPGSQVITDSVPTDFSLWTPRSSAKQVYVPFIEIKLETRSHLQRVPDAIDLAAL